MFIRRVHFFSFIFIILQRRSESTPSGCWIWRVVSTAIRFCTPLRAAHEKKEERKNIAEILKSVRYFNGTSNGFFIKYHFSLYTVRDPYAEDGELELERERRVLSLKFLVLRRVRWNTRVVKSALDDRHAWWRKDGSSLTIGRRAATEKTLPIRKPGKGVVGKSQERIGKEKRTRDVNISDGTHGNLKGRRKIIRSIFSNVFSLAKT